MTAMKIQIFISSLDLWLCQNATWLKFSFGGIVVAIILAIYALRIKE